ncbi:MAG TPA: hypothetical protein VLF93_04695 [Candidatus Saccharimonadales bacterium]|nr:hypothetical protein [Candidatus Saccharimonadales bacterium]
MKDIKEAIKLHEINSVLIPGAIFFYGLNLIYRNLGNFFSSDISIGAIIIFLLLSYGAGNLVQGIGNLIELYLIEGIFGDLRKLKSNKKVEKDMLQVFKNRKKLCRGVASSLLILLILALINSIFSVISIYTFLFLVAIFSLFWYMRKFESNELGL